MYFVCTINVYTMYVLLMYYVCTMFVQCMSMYVYVSMCLRVYLSIYLPTYLSIYLSVRPSVCLSVRRSVSLSLSLELSQKQTVMYLFNLSIYSNSIYTSPILYFYTAVCVSKSGNSEYHATRLQHAPLSVS